MASGGVLETQVQALCSPRQRNLSPADHRGWKAIHLVHGMAISVGCHSLNTDKQLRQTGGGPAGGPSCQACCRDGPQGSKGSNLGVILQFATLRKPKASSAPLGLDHSSGLFAREYSSTIQCGDCAHDPRGASVWAIASSS